MSRNNKFNDILHDNNSFEFETLINNLNEWENNPIEASRHCFKHLYNILRYQEKKIEIIDNKKASNNDLNSGLNTKINITDFMNTLNEITQNIELRPTLDQVQFFLSEKISKNEIKDLINNKPSLEDIKSYINNGQIKLSIKSIIEDLNRNFISYKNMSYLLSTKVNKDDVVNVLSQKADKKDFEILKDEINKLNDKIKGIDNNLGNLVNNMEQQLNDMNNNSNNNKQVDKKDFINVVNQINNIESKINENSNFFNFSVYFIGYMEIFYKFSFLTIKMK